MKQFLVRLDDASPTMVEERWAFIYDILKSHRIMPLVGVIPHNEDPTQQSPVIPGFWEMMRKWEGDGVTIALHGYNHCYDKSTGGLNPMWPRSEFVGKSRKVQAQKIKDGYQILIDNNLNPKVFFAPSHTYDITTIECLKELTPIRVISDTIAFKPYKEYGMTFVPQQSGHFINIPFNGIWTFCFHPNTMDDKAIKKFSEFITKNVEKFISFKDLDLSKVPKKTIADKLLNKLYFLKRGKA